MVRLPLFVLLALSFACQKVDKTKAGSGSGSGSATTATTGSGSAAAAPAGDPLDSKDILARTKPADEVVVKHVLFGWKELSAAYADRWSARRTAPSGAKARDDAR